MERIVENTTLTFQLKLNNFIGEKKKWGKDTDNVYNITA